jgi:hypothetical protein
MAISVLSGVLAWPVHISLPSSELTGWRKGLNDVAEVVCLSLSGTVMSAKARSQLKPRSPSKTEWVEGLSSMRRVLTTMSNARVALGGRTTAFKGAMPGIAEEALAALKAHQPLFLVGGFGGCTLDVCVELGIARSGPARSWTGRERFLPFSVADLNNGLTPEENRTLARTPHIDEAVALILRGLVRKAGDEPMEASS